MNVTRLFDILDRYTSHFQKDDALAGKNDVDWIKYSTEEYLRRKQTGMKIIN